MTCSAISVCLCHGYIILKISKPSKRIQISVNNITPTMFLRDPVVQTHQETPRPLMILLDSCGFSSRSLFPTLYPILNQNNTVPDLMVQICFLRHARPLYIGQPWIFVPGYEMGPITSNDKVQMRKKRRQLSVPCEIISENYSSLIRKSNFCLGNNL